MATKKPKPPPDDPAQSARFVETAKELGADASGGEAFAREFKKIVPKKTTPAPQLKISSISRKKS